MTKNDTVTNRDLYDIINDLRKEMACRIDKIEIEVRETTNWKNQLTGKITVLVAVIGIGVNILWDYLFNKH